MTSTKDIARLAVGCALCLGYPVLAYLSLDGSVSLSPAVIGGYVVLTAIMLRELESVSELVEAWRGD